jgi:hypothetical protein
VPSLLRILLPVKSIWSRHFFSLLVAPIFLVCFAPAAQAASFTWGSPQNISGDSDVSTTGSLVDAYNIGSTGVSSQTVNGVLFQSFAVPNLSSGATSGNFAISGVSIQSSNTLGGSSSAPFTNLSSAYQAVLAPEIVSNNTPFTLTISGLTLGGQYQFEWWANESIPGTARTTATSGNSVTLADNVSGADGGLGQFALGSFTADASTQVVTFNPVISGVFNFAELNAFQLRQISGPAGVPETGGTLALLALALGGLALLSRRQAA